MATLRQNTSAILSDLRAINREIDRAAGASLPSAPGRGRTVGRGDLRTPLTLDLILQGINGIRRVLQPSAADERSIL